MLDRVVDAGDQAFVSAYECRIRRLGAEREELRERVANCGRPLQSFDEAFRTALAFLANPHGLWVSERLEGRRAVPRLAFADRRQSVRNEGFRTASMALPSDQRRKLQWLKTHELERQAKHTQTLEKDISDDEALRAHASLPPVKVQHAHRLEELRRNR